MPISRKKHPILYGFAVEWHRLKRSLLWHFGGVKYAKKHTKISLPFVVKRHQSLLLRKLGNTDMRLQHSKVTNLRLAAQRIDGILIRPGETFSLWKLIGRATKGKGYREGVLLSQGEVIAGIGGGLCQMANLMYWMALHSPLKVVEHHHHSFDAFPDSGRVLPFGSGATIFYNYFDLQFKNTTSRTLQFRIWLDDEFLRGELLTDREMTESYKIVERNHRFVYSQSARQHFRENEIYQRVIDKRTGQTKRERLVTKNHAEMKYEPPADAEVVVVP